MKDNVNKYKISEDSKLVFKEKSKMTNINFFFHH